MYDGMPEDISEHLQNVGEELMNGSLDKVSAVIRLVGLGWSHEEADATVTEMVEQVETTKKLLRDASRVLDDSPSGQARATARLREAGFSTNDANYLVHQMNQQRHVAVGRVRDVLQAIRLGKLGRFQAVEQLTDRGMEHCLAATIVDVYTDSAAHWSAEWFRLSIALSLGATLTTIGVSVMFFHELMSLLGVVLAFFLAIPLMVFTWSWKNWRFWNDWTMIHQSQRECPRSCSPMIMLSEGRGRGATTLTAMEWGLSRDSATELVRRRSSLNIRAYAWITFTGAAFALLSLSSSLYSLWREPGQFFSIAIIDAVMAAVGGVLLYSGIRGWRLFAKP